MQLDLALFLRLSRTLESTHTDSLATGDDYIDILGALDRLFLTVSERMELLRTSETARPATVGIEVEELAETKEVAPEVEEVDEAPPQVWTAQHDFLYEDILWLFKVGDNEGALISLGRLLHVAGDTPELKRFLDINQKKLVGLYERMLGSFKKNLAVAGNGLGDRYFWDMEGARTVLQLGRDCGSVSKLLDQSPLSTMKTLALIHRMAMEGIFSFPK